MRHKMNHYLPELKPASVRQRIFLLVIILCISRIGVAQVYTNKETGKKNNALIDSIEHKGWPYVLPIQGKKTTAIGTQFHANKHFMVRGEYGFPGSRTHFLIGLQYRSGL